MGQAEVQSVQSVDHAHFLQHRRSVVLLGDVLGQERLHSGWAMTRLTRAEPPFCATTCASAVMAPLGSLISGAKLLYILCRSGDGFEIIAAHAAEHIAQARSSGSRRCRRWNC